MDLTLNYLHASKNFINSIHDHRKGADTERTCLVKKSKDSNDKKNANWLE
jgi:1,4-dihydroxy-2-naphthoate octaprenyltransferase